MMNKLWVELIRCFKIAGLTMVCSSSLVYAQSNNNMSPEDRAIAKHANTIKDNATELIGEDWLEKFKNDSQKAQASDFFKKLQKEHPVHSQMSEREKEKNHVLDGDYNTLVFISYSLGEQSLKEILTHASKDPQSLLVMRGIPDGTTLWEGMNQLQQMAATLTPVPNIILNPNLFKRFNIKQVPTVVKIENLDPNDPFAAESEDNLKEIARVQGMSDTLWLNKRIEGGETGDLGVRGPIAEIAEPDLIEVLKARALAIDWEQKKEQALSRVWQNQQFFPLKKVTKTRVKLIDPTITFTQDLKSESGDVIARKGDKVNPLDLRPFDFALVVFDPTDRKQREVAKIKMHELLKTEGINQVHFLVTQIDREKGWDFYNELSDELDAHIFMLNNDIISRFHLEATPSIVQAKDKQFMVTELFANDVLYESNSVFATNDEIAQSLPPQASTSISTSTSTSSSATSRSGSALERPAQ